MSQQTLEAAYRQKFLAQDREWLAAEAQRDPKQFLDVSQKIGVVDPKTLPDHTPPLSPEQEAVFQQGPPQAPVLPPPGAAAVPPPMPPQQVQAMLPQVMPPPPAPPAPPIMPPQAPPMVPPPGMLPPQV